MAIDYDPGEYIAALGDIGALLNDNLGIGSAGIDNLNNVGIGGNSFFNAAVQQEKPVLGPDEFGSYVIPPSDPTYRTGFDYARSIAGGIPMSQVIAPGVSYSPEQPMGYTQAQLNTPIGTTPVEPPPPPPTQEPDDPSFLGTGIGGVRIPVDRDMKMPPLRDIFGGKRDTSSLENLMNIGKLFSGGIDQDAIDRIVQERIAERMPTIEQPDFSQFVRREDIPTLIPEVPTGRDFSIDRQQLIEDIRSGIDLPVYETPDLSQFVRREDIPSLIPSVPTGREFSIDRDALIRDIREGIDIPRYEVPDLSGFARLEDIPTYQAPDLSGITTRLSDLEKGLLTLQEPTGGRFSVQQQRPMGLLV